MVPVPISYSMRCSTLLTRPRKVASASLREAAKLGLAEQEKLSEPTTKSYLTTHGGIKTALPELQLRMLVKPSPQR